MNFAKKIMEAPVRGVANAIAAAAKDAVYSKSRVRERQVEQVSLLAGIVSEIEQVAPKLLKWFLLATVIHYGMKWLNGGMGRSGGVAGVPVGCRCVEWRCD